MKSRTERLVIKLLYHMFFQHFLTTHIAHLPVPTDGAVITFLHRNFSDQVADKILDAGFDGCVHL